MEEIPECGDMVHAGNRQGSPSWEYNYSLIKEYPPALMALKVPTR